MIAANVRFCLLSLLLILTSQQQIERVQAKENHENIIRNWLLNRLSTQQQQQQSGIQTPDYSSVGVSADPELSVEASEPTTDLETERLQENLEKLDELLRLDLTTWDLDIFMVQKLSGEHSLPVIVFELFRQWDLFEEFTIGPEILLNYLFKLEAGYNKNAFHNSIHAADVVQSANFLIQSLHSQLTFTKLEIMATIFAAAVHNLDHPGYTNQFLTETSHTLAILYNDQSVLENHSLAEAFKMLLMKESETTSANEDFNFLKNLNSDQMKIFRKLVIEMALASDPIWHNTLLGMLKKIVNPDENSPLEPAKQSENPTMLKIILHSADVSQALKPRSIYDKWLLMLKEEACKQAELEKALNIATSSVCVRPESCKIQLDYIDNLVLPWWEQWINLLKHEGKIMLQNLVSNRRFYANHCQH